MLKSLDISNIAVIEKASIEFDDGLNILTGETGAGKSIIIDSINAVLGERTTRELVRSGAQKGSVAALFCNVSKEVEKKLEKYDIETENDGTLLITRSISCDGKSVCKVNSRPVTVSMLKDIGKHLINIHGQHDSQALLDDNLHYQYVDMLIGSDELKVYDRYYEKFRYLIEIRRKIKSLSVDEEEKERKCDFLKYRIAEIESASLKIGEKEELEKRRNIISNSETLLSSLNDAYACLNGSDGFEGAYLTFANACRQMKNLEPFGDDFSSIIKKMYDTLYCIEEYKDTIRTKLDSVDFDPAELEEIESRLDTINRLCKKYGGDEESVLKNYDEAVKELSLITSSEDELLKLQEEYQKVLGQCIELADEWSAVRKKTAAAFEQAVANELSFLDMPNVNFKVNFEKGKLSVHGYDLINFVISTNPGSPLKPLSKIASGGELSRIMLAIKNIVAANDTVSTLIFDEIDTGVSGNASGKIGAKLKNVAKSCQVICVTHSAQIASYASKHLFISKRVENDLTYTQVDELDFDERAKELARIMGGDSSETLLEGAREMLTKNSEE